MQIETTRKYKYDLLITSLSGTALYHKIFMHFIVEENRKKCYLISVTSVVKWYNSNLNSLKCNSEMAIVITN